MFYRKQLQELVEWRYSSNRKPLIIRGARQVGKTTLVHDFGKQFKQYIYLNLEQKKDAIYFEESDDIQQLLTRIFLEKRLLLTHISETLLFIDEIQELPKAINLLRYFKEEAPQLAVIAAGSMLETLVGKQLTFPVGRVEYKVLRPFSFEEFLLAMGEQQLLDEYIKTPVEKYAEPSLFEAFRTYALIGGMPEIIAQFSVHRDVTALGKVYDSLINSYLDDAEKYAKNDQQLQIIRFSIRQSLIVAGQRTSFQQFGNSNYSSKAVGEVLRALEKTHLIQILYPVTGTTLPLEHDLKKTPRIHFLDTGLMNYFAGLQKDVLGTKDLSTIYQGKMIEHLVGQELLSFQSLSLSKLNFWVRQKNQSDAEVDFIYPYKGKLVPIEVKSGAQGHLKSLHVFIDNSPIRFAIRFYAGTFQLDKLKTSNGKQFYLLNLPYFLASQVEKYIDWLSDEVTWHDNQINIVSEHSSPEYRKSKKPDRRWAFEDLKSKHIEILRFCLDGPQKGRDLLEEKLGLTYQSRNKGVFIKPLFELGLIEFTIKDYEKSKQQRYAITEKGREFLKSL